MKMVKTIRTESLGGTHAVFFTREYDEDWGYMGMRDYMTYEPTEFYGVRVVPYNKYTHRADNTDAGYVKGSFRADGFDKDVANRIWWNIKNGIAYETLRDAMKEMGLLKVEA